MPDCSGNSSPPCTVVQRRDSGSRRTTSSARPRNRTPGRTTGWFSGANGAWVSSCRLHGRMATAANCKLWAQNCWMPCLLFSKAMPRSLVAARRLVGRQSCVHRRRHAYHLRSRRILRRPRVRHRHDRAFRRLPGRLPRRLQRRVAAGCWLCQATRPLQPVSHPQPRQPVWRRICAAGRTDGKEVIAINRGWLKI